MKDKIFKFSIFDRRSELNLIKDSGLILNEWYLSQYQDLNIDVQSVAEHFLGIGWREGRNPNPYFDTKWYIENVMHETQDQCPLIHYIHKRRKVNTSLGLSIDEYCAANPGARRDPLHHYVKHGVHQHKSPFPKELSLQQIMFEVDASRLLDREWYLNYYPDLRGSSVNALEHYCLFGWKEGRKPNPYFDQNWYSTKVKDKIEKFPPLLHYVKTGWKLGLSPSQKFNLTSYLEEHKDVFNAGVEPLSHYFDFGRQEGRKICQVHEAPDFEQLEETGLFISSWYENRYEDLRDAGLNLHDHFLSFGANENRNPNPYFDTSWYVKKYEEYIPKDENPVLYYAREGWRLGHNPSLMFDSALYIEYYLKEESDCEPVKHYLRIGKKNGNIIKSLNEMVPSTGGRLKVNRSAKLVKDSALRALLDQEPRDLSPESKLFNPQRLNIHWVMPDFAPGAGGHMTIFRTIRLLEFFGHKNTIWIYNPTNHDTPESAYDDIVKYFQVIQGEIKFVDHELAAAKGDVIMATDWGSVSYVSSVAGFKRRFYFVQDHEPEFYPQGSLSIAAKLTYSTDIDCICASPWLKGLMENKYGRWASEFWLSVDKNIYFPSEQQKNKNSVVKIAFYARHFTPRRAVELGLLALERLASADLNIEVHCFGANLPFDEAPFECVDHGILTPLELAELYCECDLGIVFSATNYSLIPQEMMACGLPLVELDTESTRAIFPENIVTLASPNPRIMAAQLRDLIQDPSRRKLQAQQALEWVSTFTWEKAAKDIEAAILKRLVQLKFRPNLVKKNLDQAKKASVIIPTWNGGEVFKKVIVALENQKTPWPYEVLVLDSGSSDDTIDFVKGRKSIKLFEIPNSEFQHGRTRNLAASLTTGEYIAVLTQDALPADDYWLYNMIAHLEHFPESAGAFGKHLAWPDADPFTKRDLSSHFSNLLNYPIYLSKESDKSKWESEDISWRQLLHFYSDNNSCMRRSVWEKLPYPEVKFGEDQAWAWEVIKSGYGKIYACQSVVYHSHDFDEGNVEKRAYEEAEFFRDVFGYNMISSGNISPVLESINLADTTWAESVELDSVTIDRRKSANEKKLLGFKKAYKEGCQ